MAMRDIFTDLTDLIHPDVPELALDPRARNAREEFERDLRLAWEHDEDDPLLGQIAAARRAMLDAEKRLRLLVAYGREFVAPRPYKLDDLAQAAGMSISGVRTAYADDEVAEVAQLTGAKPRTRTTASTS